MKPASLSLPTLLLWVLIALLPLRGWASASMAMASMPAPAPASTAAEGGSCHGAHASMSAHTHHAEPVGPATPGEAMGQGKHHGTCHSCDLCHSPPLVDRQSMGVVEAPSCRAEPSADVKVVTSALEPRLRPPRI